MGVCGVLAFAILAVQLFHIQIISHADLERRAIEQQVREVTVMASRGTIFDTTGAVLAQSASVENIFISPNAIHTYERDQLLIARGLAELLDVEEAMILSRMENKNSQFETIRNHVEWDLAFEVREFIAEHNLERIVFLEPAMRRYYPQGRTAAHVLGFVGTEGRGLGYGVEGSYNEHLMGTDGRLVRLRAGARDLQMLRTNYEDYFSAQPGSDLHLTIDLNIQQIMERHLTQAIKDFDLLGGAFAMAMNPHTGAILGMVSLDDFNPNAHGRLTDERMEALREQFPDEEDPAFWAAVNEELAYSWRNKNIGYAYEPGSTFKFVTLAIALEEGIVTADTDRIFYCRGWMDVPGRTEPVNCHLRQGHGPLRLSEVMQFSCNPGTVELAMDIGADLFFEYLIKFGLVERTGVDLQGESLGILWSEEDWNFYARNNNLSSLAAASFGQTFTLTPIRLATITSALVNGGYILEPFTVERIVSPDGAVTLENTPTVRRQVISEETSATVLAMMEETVTRGTGSNAMVEGFRIGGKTGTSTDTVLEAQGIKAYVASFVSAAPTDNPEIVLLVSLQNPGPNNQTYVSGGQMAAPVAGRMLAEILPYLGIEPNFGWGAVRVNAQVPYVRQQTVQEAERTLRAEGFDVLIQGQGEHVMDQVPAGGAVVRSGTQVVLYLDRERSEDMVAVPDVHGMRYTDAIATLEARGLYVRRSGSLTSAGTVVVYSQSRAPADIVRRGTVIEISLIDTTRDRLS